MIRYCSTEIVNPPSSLGLDGVSPIHNPGHPFRVNISHLSSIRITSSPNGLLVISFLCLSFQYISVLYYNSRGKLSYGASLST